MSVGHALAVPFLALGAYTLVCDAIILAIVIVRGGNTSLVWIIGSVSLAIGLALWPGLAWGWAAVPLALDPGLLLVFGVVYLIRSGRPSARSRTS